jgi:hypothetical protein
MREKDVTQHDFANGFVLGGVEAPAAVERGLWRLK